MITYDHQMLLEIRDQCGIFYVSTSFCTQVVGCFNLQLIVGGVSLLLTQSDFWSFLNSGIIEGGSSWVLVRKASFDGMRVVN